MTEKSSETTFVSCGYTFNSTEVAKIGRVVENGFSEPFVEEKQINAVILDSDCVSKEVGDLVPIEMDESSKVEDPLDICVKEEFYTEPNIKKEYQFVKKEMLCDTEIIQDTVAADEKPIMMEENLLQGEDPLSCDMCVKEELDADCKCNIKKECKSIKEELLCDTDVQNTVAADVKPIMMEENSLQVENPLSCDMCVKEELDADCKCNIKNEFKSIKEELLCDTDVQNTVAADVKPIMMEENLLQVEDLLGCDMCVKEELDADCKCNIKNEFKSIKEELLCDTDVENTDTRDTSDDIWSDVTSVKMEGKMDEDWQPCLVEEDCNGSDIDDQVVSCDSLLKCESVVTKEDGFSCKICKTLFKTKESFYDHRCDSYKDNEFVCHICDKLYTRRASLFSHIRSHSKEKVFCDICKKSFVNKYSLPVHMRIHSGVKPFSCNICKKSFTKKQTYMNHMSEHNGVTLNACSICNKSYASKSIMLSHMGTHVGANPFSCNVCNMSFALKRYLSEHLSIHTGEKPFGCDICKKSFRMKKGLSEHIRDVHTGVTRFSCHICKRGFVRKRTYLDHLNIHKRKKPFSCRICKKSYNQKPKLLTHECIRK